jgi:hypothetical protein
MATKIPVRYEIKEWPRWVAWAIIGLVLLVGSTLVMLYGNDIFQSLFVGK